MKPLLQIVLVLLTWVGAGSALAQDEAQTMDVPITVGDGFYEQAEQALEAQNYDRALLDISLYILLNPTYSPGYFQRGIIYSQRGQDGDTSAALGDFDNALTLAVGDFVSPDYRAALYVYRASAHLAADDIEAAFVDYERSLAEAPTISALINRGFLYAREQDYERALADMDAALALTEDAATDAQIYMQRAAVNALQMDDAGVGSDYFNYILLVATDAVEVDAIALGDLVPLEMVEGRVFVIPFNLQAGDVISAVAAPSEGSAVDPLLVVLAPDGTPLAGSDDLAQGDLTALVRDLTVTETGTYALVVSHAGGGSEGALVVSVQLAP